MILWLHVTAHKHTYIIWQIKSDFAMAISSDSAFTQTRAIVRNELCVLGILGHMTCHPSQVFYSMRIMRRNCPSYAKAPNLSINCI